MPFKPVHGFGPSNAEIMIVGEAPGEDESDAEEPFVGAAGRMLNKTLESCKINRKNIYVCNTVNCRPTKDCKNRPPDKKEIQLCGDWLNQQIEVVKPKVIFTLGKVPTRYLLKLPTTIKLEDYVGKIQKGDDYIIIPNWHPSYLLQYGRAKTEDAIRVFKLGLTYLEERKNG